MAVARVKGGFLKQQSTLLEGLIVILDLLVVSASFLISHKFIVGTYSPSLEFLFIIQVTVVVTYLVFRESGIYRSARGHSLAAEIGKLALAWLLVIVLIGMVAFLTKTGEIISRRWFGLSSIIALGGLASFRLVLRQFLNSLRKRGLNWRSVLVVGTGKHAINTIETLEQNPWTGMKIAGIVSKDNFEDSETLLGHSVVASLESIHSYIERQRELDEPIDQVWVALPLKEEASIHMIIDTLRDSSADVCVVPDLLGAQLLHGAIDEIGGIPLISLSNVRITSAGEAVKRLFDFSVASIGLVAVSPLLIIIAVLIKFESVGPVFFKQRRYGVDGREIVVWKFRSMNTTEDGKDVIQATSEDKRVTRIGRYLRRTSLDELPQLFNVVGGSMSLVGPRPHAVAHNEEYRKKISGYMMRHKIKPGITGWAQVNGWRGETDTLEKMEKRVEFDLEYMKNWSPWFDIKILALTLVRGFKNNNAY
ncbi:MAG: undecaprenyl-phosphate glucose phosphotransferase [Acidiferrobacterales bacterium]|nr:undecaprenyl-phosphate glucose phosphotransferase [Acidiferrobacterales bacterium]